jgi:hypothetical protein
MGGGEWTVPTYRDEAIVLHIRKLGEADRIITMLTRAHGKVRAVAKGMRRRWLHAPYGRSARQLCTAYPS